MSALERLQVSVTAVIVSVLIAFIGWADVHNWPIIVFYGLIYGVIAELSFAALRTLSSLAEVIVCMAADDPEEKAEEYYEAFAETRFFQHKSKCSRSIRMAGLGLLALLAPFGLAIVIAVAFIVSLVVTCLAVWFLHFKRSRAFASEC